MGKIKTEKKKTYIFICCYIFQYSIVLVLVISQLQWLTYDEACIM
jgi:hypothetical protein